MIVFSSPLCMSVCLSVCQRDISSNCRRILVIFRGEIYDWKSDFDGNPDDDVRA